MSEPVDRCVVVTGAGGRIGTVIREKLAADWSIRATDMNSGDGIEALDVTDFDRCVAVFHGADAVVHLAANPNPHAGWEELRGPNLDGAYVVAAAARECGVRRLVLASSVQALSAYPEARQLRGVDAPRAANLYGATKAWAEALGGWVAASSDTSVVALRIGYFSEKPPAGEDATPRNLSAWLSHADCARLIQAAVESVHDDFVIVNGVSANRYRLAELGEAERRIGYEPMEDAWAQREQNGA